MISMIIPVLNEALIIESFLKYISGSSSAENITEILVVDGGSIDGTQQLIRNFAESSNLKIDLITSGKGRAKQMNTGAKKAKGNILYFLHADSLPPRHFDEQIIKEVNNKNFCGCFRLKFDEPHLLLRFSQWFTRFNFKFCRGGDQSLFVSNKIFLELNGFNENYTIYEDCEFINRLYDHTHFTIINDYIITSARRYNVNGTWKLQYHFTIIHLKKWLGSSPQNLNNYYQRHIAS